MTVIHCPEDELLLDYSAGGLGEAGCLAIAIHLVFCPKCRRTVNLMESVGGSLFSSLSAGIGMDDMYNQVSDRIDRDNGSDTMTSVNDDEIKKGISVFPGPLSRYLGDKGDALDWRRVGFGIYEMPILTPSDTAVARVLRIEGGRTVPSHSHRGVELTLVLSGAYRDHTGKFGRGDLQVADETIEHKPGAEPGSDCICLAVTEAPVRFNSLAAKLALPFFRV